MHGGADKAVYVYPAEHYPYWQDELGRKLPWGIFGENLTVEDAPLEHEVAIGDRLRIGSAEFLVTQPRLPCFKLGIRFNDPGMVRRFLRAGRSGYYLRIVVEGEVAAGDRIDLVAPDPTSVPVSEITRLYTRDQDDIEAIRRLLSVDTLPDEWRPYFEQALTCSFSNPCAPSAPLRSRSALLESCSLTRRRGRAARRRRDDPESRPEPRGRPTRRFFCFLTPSAAEPVSPAEQAARDFAKPIWDAELSPDWRIRGATLRPGRRGLRKIPETSRSCSARDLPQESPDAFAAAVL